MACVSGIGPACTNVETLSVFKTVTVEGGDFTAAGVGTRNTGSGTIKMTTIPPDSVVTEAYLYWNVIVESDFGPSDFSVFMNGVPVSGSCAGRCGNTCWEDCDPAIENRVWRSGDLGPSGTGDVTGNGDFAITGLPFDGSQPINPDGVRQPGCMGSNGAVLVVLYELSESMQPYRDEYQTREITIIDGAILISSLPECGGVLSASHTTGATDFVY